MDIIQINNELKVIISKHIETEEFDFNTDLSDLGVDSVTKIDIMVDIENHFEIKVEDDEFSDLTTIEKMSEFIGNLLK